MERFVFFIVLMVVTQISDVDAATRNSDIIGMAVAGCVSFVLLSVVIAFIVITFHWRNWLNSWMRLRGRVRMSRAYVHKKEEAKRRLISGTSVSKTVAGFPDPSLYETIPDVKEWTLGSTHLTPYRIYEDKDATIELGEEDDDIFTIETEVLEDEAPKYVPVRHDPKEDSSVKDHEEEEPTYSTADSFKKIKQAEEELMRAGDTPLTIADRFPPADELQQTYNEHNGANNVRTTSF